MKNLYWVVQHQVKKATTGPPVVVIHSLNWTTRLMRGFLYKNKGDMSKHVALCNEYPL